MRMHRVMDCVYDGGGDAAAVEPVAGVGSSWSTPMRGLMVKVVVEIDSDGRPVC